MRKKPEFLFLTPAEAAAGRAFARQERVDRDVEALRQRVADAMEDPDISDNDEVSVSLRSPYGGYCLAAVETVRRDLATAGWASRIPADLVKAITNVADPKLVFWPLVID